MVQVLNPRYTIATQHSLHYHCILIATLPRWSGISVVALEVTSGVVVCVVDIVAISAGISGTSVVAVVSGDVCEYAEDCVVAVVAIVSLPCVQHMARSASGSTLDVWLGLTTP